MARSRIGKAAAGSMLAIFAAAASPLCARAGVVFLSRQSAIAAAGAMPNDPAGDFSLSDGATNFNPYSNDLASDGSSPATATAHQYSYPDGTPGGFQGAYAEGSTQAQLDAAGATAQANSSFDVAFKVTAPTSYLFGAALGASGAGAADAKLTWSAPSGATSSIFDVQTGSGPAAQPDAERQGTLEPGIYGLTVTASSKGTSAPSSSYYTVNLMIDAPPSAPSAAAVPLPPVIWPAMGTIGLGAWLTRRSRQRGRIAA